MARVTIDEVRAIIQTKASDTIITQYIDSASAMMEVLGDAALSPRVMKEIERWITAHLLASSRDRQAREEGAGGAYIRYGGMTYTGLKGTTYGQQAIALDTSRTLDSLSGKAAKIWVIKERD